MKVFKTNKELIAEVSRQKSRGKTIGFVPTLGALHDGHASLIRKSRRIAAVTVCSIFVNPTQFNDPKDLEKYPRTLMEDLEILHREKCDILYLPETEEVYPPGLDFTVPVDFGNLFNVMEGAFRPGHFEGVVTVVKRLLDIVDPNFLFMGQKDFQQLTIIRHMIDKLGLSVKLISCSTKREPNGLAMSSRNLRLSQKTREKASIIYRTLSAVRRKIKNHSPEFLEKYALKKLNIPGFQPEYFSIVDGNSLLPVKSFEESEFVVACTAVWAENIRLIDNKILKKTNI